MVKIATLDVQVRQEEELERAFAVLRRSAADESSAARLFDRLLVDFLTQHHRSMFWGDRLLTLDKSAGFKNEPRFREAMREVNSSTGTNQYSSPDKISWRLHTLIWAASCALKVPGDFVECGVFKGDMSWVVTETVDLEAAGKKLFAYDTFNGFDVQNSSEKDFPEAPQVYHRLNNEYREPGIYESVVKRFAAKPYVKVIKGVVPEILCNDAPASIAFLHLDMNSAPAERAALEVLFDRMSDGAIIIFDDYGWILHRKQKEAADEFMNARGFSVLELPTGQGLALLSKAALSIKDATVGPPSLRLPPNIRKVNDNDGVGPAAVASLVTQSTAKISQEFRAELNAKLATAKQEIRSNLTRAILDGNESIRAVITEHAISADDVRRATVRIPGRRFVALVAVVSAATTAIITAALLIGAYFLRL